MVFGNMIKLLLLCLIAIAHFHLISGLSLETESKERIARAPETVFNKLTAAENEERLEKCGKLKWPYQVSAESKWQALANYPWVVEVFEERFELDPDILVVISKRHMLADRHSLRNVDISVVRRFADRVPFVHVAPTAPARHMHIPLTVSALYCTGNFSGSCPHARFQKSPSKFIIDDFNNPRIVLLEFDQDIPIDPICLPEKELVTGEEVFVQNRDESYSNSHNYTLFASHANGWAAHKTNDPKRDFSQVLVKKENERFTIAGNWNHYAKAANSSYLVFSSVFQFTDKICEYTGACPSTTRVELKMLSKEENEERLKMCGTVPNHLKPLTAATLENSAPWIVPIRLTEVYAYIGYVVSKRHILTNRELLTDPDWKKAVKNDGLVNKSISMKLPVMRDSKEVLNIRLAVFPCSHEDCEAKGYEEVNAVKMFSLPGSYILLETDQDMDAIPVCLTGDLYTSGSDEVYEVAKDGSRDVLNVKKNDRKATVLKVSYSTGEHFPEVLMHKRNRAFTVVGLSSTLLIYQWNLSHDWNMLNFSSWITEQEKLCKVAGICAKSMIPLPLAENETRKLTEEENEQRLASCGLLNNGSVASRDAPWLVGIRSNSNQSSTVHTGVVISNRHVLMDGVMLKDRRDLHEFFGDFQQDQYLTSEIPEYQLPGAKFQFEVHFKQCDGSHCLSKKEFMRKPTRLLAYISNPSVLVLEFDEPLTNTPICLEDDSEAKEGDRILIQSYTEMKTRVLSTTGDQIEVAISALEEDASKVIVKKVGDRMVLVGNWIYALEPSKDPSSKWFLSAFAARNAICGLTGVCPPFYRFEKIEKASDEEKKEMLKCGRVANPSLNTSVPTVARDAPWIVGIYAQDTQIHTGAVVAPRHVLVDDLIFREDMDTDTALGKRPYNGSAEELSSVSGRSLLVVSTETFGNDFSPGDRITVNFEGMQATLPLSRSGLQLRVKTSVCSNSLCTESEEREHIPKRILVDRTRSRVILQFSESLPVTPLCTHDIYPKVKFGDEVYVQDYTDPESLLTRKELTDSFSGLLLVNTTSRDFKKHSQVAVRKIDGRYSYVTNLNPSNAIRKGSQSFVYLNDDAPTHDQLCLYITACPYGRPTVVQR